MNAYAAADCKCRDFPVWLSLSMCDVTSCVSDQGDFVCGALLKAVLAEPFVRTRQHSSKYCVLPW